MFKHYLLFGKIGVAVYFIILEHFLIITDSTNLSILMHSRGTESWGDALKNGYIIHPAFPKIDKVYQSNILFPAFDRRIPSSDRADYKAILTDLGLDESASKMDILRETRGRSASDTYSFEQPLAF